MTLKDAKEILKFHGMFIRKRDNEYRVNFLSGNEATVYYTDDLLDAINTGVDMRTRRIAQDTGIVLLSMDDVCNGALFSILGE